MICHGHAYIRKRTILGKGGIDMNKFLTVVGLLLSLGLVFYIESDSSTLKYDFQSSIFLQPGEELEAEYSTEAAASPDESEELGIPSLEFKFEEANVVNGYIVEEYREYEIYEDANGNVIKEQPTSNVEYIRYKK
jgi:hypothetical protein